MVGGAAAAVQPAERDDAREATQEGSDVVDLAAETKARVLSALRRPPLPPLPPLLLRRVPVMSKGADYQ